MINKTKKELIDRQQLKSSEEEFIRELENSYELSPGLSSLILMTARGCLIREERLKEGQIEVTVIGIEEREGKVIETSDSDGNLTTSDTVP